jgi:hypothetical protein
MDTYNSIEKLIADQHGKSLGTRKAIGDFMLTDSHAVNVKSNNVDKQNYSPNMISIKKMHKWVFEDRHDLSFVFVDYKQKDGKVEVLKQSGLIPIERISWNCLQYRPGLSVVLCFVLILRFALGVDLWSTGRR